MKRYLFLLYGISNHVLFLAVYAVLACFVANFYLPKTIDTPSSDSTAQALVINVLLMALFGVQHSVMARPAFKRLWTKIVPAPIERSTYVLASNVVTVLLMWQWRGMTTVVWDVSHPAIRQVMWGLFVAGWLMVPLVTFMISHFDLFGTRQVWLHFLGKENKAMPFRTPMLYQHMRHPLYVGWAIAFWATPTMTIGHLAFAIVLTGYMALAVVWEERDLVAHFGQVYEDYRARVPKYLPRWNFQEQNVISKEVAAEVNLSASSHDSLRRGT